jgi:hypothetical protein
LGTRDVAAPFTPVTGSGGTAPLTYSVSPALPPGLSMASSSGAIIGTPIAVSATTTYSVTVTDANGAAATASFGLTVNSAVTATALSSSVNPSQFRQPVTFTAIVTGNAPTGVATFFDGGTQLGVATLAGGKASFTTSELAVGNHAITTRYGGDGSNAGSTSAVLIQTVNVPADSVRLREMQVSTMPTIAQASGQAISGAIDSAIAAGFNGNPKLFAPNGAGFTYYFGGDTTPSPSEEDSLKRFLASPDNTNARVDDSFRVLGYAGPLKAPPAPVAQPRTWLAWIDFRGTDYYGATLTGDLKGTQVNATAGLTHLITPNLLVGALGGYEHFDYNSQGFSSVPRGDGWTTGGYLGWRIGPNLRFDAAAAWTDILANDVSGAANGNFTGSRLLTSGGLTGTYGWQRWTIEPSARVYALWERENAYTDSLGTLQAEHTFETDAPAPGPR